MQKLHGNTGWKRWAPLMAAMVGGMALLPRQLEAQTQATPQAPVQSGEVERKSGYSRSIQVGDYTLRIADAQNIWASYQSLIGNDLRLNRTTLSDLQAETSLNAALVSQEKGPKFRWNLNLRLDIEGRKPGDSLLLGGVENIRSLDDQGRALPGLRLVSPTGWTRSRAWTETKKQEALGLQKEPDSKSLQTLEGDLIVVNGAVRTLTFAEEDLHPGASKSAGEVRATVHSIKKTVDGYQVSITCTSREFVASSTLSLPDETFPSIFEQRPQIEFLGTNGVRYKSNGEEVGTNQGSNPPTPAKAGASAGLRPLTWELTYTFYGIPDGVRPGTVSLRVVEQQGENFRVPIKFTDIPLAVSR